LFAASPRESEWGELKHGNANPQKIGENVSAVSNGAALLGKPAGYVLGGVADDSHNLVGTSFKPRDTKIGKKAGQRNAPVTSRLGGNSYITGCAWGTIETSVA